MNFSMLVVFIPELHSSKKNHAVWENISSVARIISRGSTVTVFKLKLIHSIRQHTIKPQVAPFGAQGRADSYPRSTFENTCIVGLVTEQLISWRRCA